ncbi:hypothetical protein [Chlorogloeopsis sp. ULAP02]|uniref:hypothetical protein n=1 Tax=Chlorogloeopsis sp. ULAP02 TaxID=3107926 RepID=UPI003136375A
MSDQSNAQIKVAQIGFLATVLGAIIGAVGTIIASDKVRLPFFTVTPQLEEQLSQEERSFVADILKDLGSTVKAPSFGQLFTKEDGNLSIINLGQVKNFIVEVTFPNPSHTYWDYGFIFRDRDSSQYRLAFNYDLDKKVKWTLTVVTIIPQREKPQFKKIQWGEVQDFRQDSSQANKIRLIVYEDIGLLYVNNQFLSKLSVGELPSEGEIAIATDMFGDSEGNVVSYSGLYLWKLERSTYSTRSEPTSLPF